jgi:outer membrane protein X
MKTLSLVKRVALLAVFATAVAVNGSAQEAGDKAVGLNVAMGMGDGYTNIGFGPKFQYNVTAPIRLEASFTYFLKKDYITMWDANVNAHYLFGLGDKAAFYPLAGLCIVNTGVSYSVDLGEYGSVGGSASESRFGANLGAGLDYKLSDQLIANVEAKYKIVEGGRFVVSVGLAYKF